MDTKALYKISYGLYVVGTKIDGRYAAASWTRSSSPPVRSVPTVILCSIQKIRQTPPSSKPANLRFRSWHGRGSFIIGNFGFQSGRDADKWANVPHTIKDGLPVLNAVAAALQGDGAKESTHTAFFCEVTDAWLGEGEPLIYGDYQKSMKTKTMEAFNAFKETGLAR